MGKWSVVTSFDLSKHAAGFSRDYLIVYTNGSYVYAAMSNYSYKLETEHDPYVRITAPVSGRQYRARLYGDFWLTSDGELKRGLTFTTDAMIFTNGIKDYKYFNIKNALGSPYMIGRSYGGGGYLYLEEYVLTPPSAPSSITVPTTVKGGESLTISWNSVSGATAYFLERSVNGGAWTQIYSGNNTNYTDTITKGWNTVAYRVRAYNSDGYSSYRTSPTREVINNMPPTISGQDSDLGNKNLGFVITYQVDDADSGDSLVVTEKLNGTILRTINGAPRNEDIEIEITNETLLSLPLNSENTIEIKVDDGQGGIAYRRYTFRRTNTAPIISGQDEDLGQKTEPFSVEFSVSDVEGNDIIVRAYLDGVQKEEYQAEDGAINTFTISKEDWFKLNIGQHSIKIEATDIYGATAVRNYIFSRYDDKIQFTLKTPIETDVAATKILIVPTWYVSEGATVKIEACNNAYDEEPTWEDITNQVLINRHYNFINDTKTADKWGINIRFTVEKGTATEQVVINGFGGAFE